MTSKQAFDELRYGVKELPLDSDTISLILASILDAEIAANDERADAFAEGRYATLEPVVRGIPRPDLLDTEESVGLGYL